jgi:hypothetical protein
MFFILYIYTDDCVSRRLAVGVAVLHRLAISCWMRMVAPRFDALLLAPYCGRCAIFFFYFYDVCIWPFWNPRGMWTCTYYDHGVINCNTHRGLCRGGGKVIHASSVPDLLEVLNHFFPSPCYTGLFVWFVPVFALL